MNSGGLATNGEENKEGKGEGKLGADMKKGSGGLDQ